ncbi:DUF2752 domain-containing protein [Psychroserpens sp.]|uniref:DUF2752 domain-containing protein n=1 Tax=Psychroserpens sp. TaxID=2020870 RepID=UPI002B27BBDA|nr:DUF2752 domain-containing protein [Psychroserpens sp.]
MLSPEEYMLPCLNKTLLGVECMGCGIQRSVALIFQGELVAAFKMYPAIFTLILLFAFIGLNYFKNYKFAGKIIISLAIINVIIIVGNFVLKTFIN